jgi:hypothetical protein
MERGLARTCCRKTMSQLNDRVKSSLRACLNIMTACRVALIKSSRSFTPCRPFCDKAEIPRTKSRNHWLQSVKVLINQFRLHLADMGKKRFQFFMLNSPR